MQWETILTASVIAAIVSGILNFLIQLFFEHRRVKERKLQEIKENDKLILNKVYIPILKILEEDIIPSDGYEGIDSDKLDRIRKIIDDNPDLVDTELDLITYGYLEDLIYMSNSQQYSTNNIKFADLDRKLFYYVLKMYNLKKKNLNLPYDKAKTVI